jgi:hypothetical protein
MLRMDTFDLIEDMTGKGAIARLFHHTPVTVILKDHLFFIADMHVGNLHGSNGKWPPCGRGKVCSHGYYVT